MENQKSLIEIALEIMEKSNSPLNIYTLIEETLLRKGITDEDGTLAAKLYTDISISSKFVYMGEDCWDLKSRQSLDQFDKDGSSFISKDEEYHDEDDSDDELDNYDDEDEDRYDDDDEDEDSDKDYDDEDEDEESDERYDEESEEEDSYDDEDERYDEESEESEEDNYDDEDKYNQIMDDYEDLYED